MSESSARNGLAKRLEDGDRRAIAKGITTLEGGGDAAEALLDQLSYDRCKAWRIGITGPPGAGKSTLTSQLAQRFAKQDQRVAILAVDPSSPFTQGAVLGDRIRMANASACENVYVRSMASRGASGGLSAATADVADLLDVSGFDVILIESVGVGQQDIDIHAIADTTLVLLVPESGDHIQTIKAGLMEAGDLYVVNKMDRPRGSAMLAAVQGSLSYQHRRDPDWSPPVVGVAAHDGTGCDELAVELQKHRSHGLTGSRAEQRRRARIEHRLWRTSVNMLEHELKASSSQGQLQAEAQAIAAGKRSLRDAARALIAPIRGEQHE